MKGAPSLMRNRSAAWIICVAISATFQSLVQAQPVQYSNVPFAITPINPCNGEIVAVNGTMDILVQMTDDGAGGTHDKGYIVSKGDGLGSAGNEYVYSDEREAELSTSGPSDQSSFSFEINHMLNAVGA